MEIQYSGQPTEKDFARMYRLASPLKPRIVILWVFFFVAMTFMLITSPQNASDLFFYIPVWIILLFFAVFWVLMPSLNAKKFYKQNEEFRNTISGVVSEEGITLHTLHSSSNIRWGLFQTAVISPNVVLLYQTRLVWNFFLRSQFANEADWQAFIALVKQGIPKFQTRATSRLPVIAGNQAQILMYGILILTFILIMVYYYSNTRSR